MIKDFPRKRGNIMASSASQSIFYDWIPAFAGMTVKGNQSSGPKHFK
jgi:hypothetical protein